MSSTLAPSWQNQDRETDWGSGTVVPVQKQQLVGLDLQRHFCHHSPVRHQKTEGIERPGEAPQFETLLAYNKWVIYDTKFKKKSQDESLQFKI